jgi:hypothetical protein
VSPVRLDYKQPRFTPDRPNVWTGIVYSAVIGTAAWIILLVLLTSD